MGPRLHPRALALSMLLVAAAPACAAAVLDSASGGGGSPGEGGGGGVSAQSTSQSTVSVSSSSASTSGSGGGGGSAPQEILFTFDSDLEGWLNENAGGVYDSAVYIAEIGNPGGSVLLNGSDLGLPEEAPNAWTRRAIALPPWASRLQFDTRAQNDAALRVRLTMGASSTTLLDWQVLSGGDWVSVELDIAAWAGQTVTLYFEQDDNGEGVGEHRYVDNVAIVD